MRNVVSVMKMASISAAGSNPKQIWESYVDGKQKFSLFSAGQEECPSGLLDVKTISLLKSIRQENDIYEHLDDTVLYALLVSRQLVDKELDTGIIGINFGSSRGATKSLERHHAYYLENGHCSSKASPSTTLGNISSWVSHDLGIAGPTISHSITCSTALHSLLNGIAWLQSGMSEKFIVGGSESAVTPFTIEQIRALRIYSKEEGEYPCRALDISKTRNTMVLGDAASAILIEDGRQEEALALISGIGYSTETLTHSVSISTDAQCFQKSMAMCLEGKDRDIVDAIVLHAPGTKKGDQAEINAIKNVFGPNLPAMTSNKWCIGHTFGASGLMSLELAIMMITHNHYIPVPYLEDQEIPKQLDNVLVNAVGFGGNAVTVLISRNK